MERGSTSYTHKLITHFSPSFRSVCMSVSVGVRTRACEEEAIIPRIVNVFIFIELNAMVNPEINGIKT